MELFLLFIFGVLDDGHIHVPPAVTGFIGWLFFNFILFSRMKDKEYDSLGKKFTRAAARRYWQMRWDNMGVSFIATLILIIWGPGIYSYATGNPLETWQEFMYLGVGPMTQWLYKISMGGK